MPETRNDAERPDSRSDAAWFPSFRGALRWRGWRTGLRVVLVVLLVVGVVDGIATAVTAGRLEAKLRALRAQGKPLSGRDLAPPPVPEADNAASLYLRAADVVWAHSGLTGAPEVYVGPKSDSGQPVSYGSSTDDWDDPATLAILTDFVRQDREALALVREATARPHAVFAIDWDHLAEARLGHYQKLRSVARFLMTAAVVASHEGDQATAIDRLRMGLVLSRHVSEQPLVIGQVLAYAVDAMSVKAAEYVLARGPIPEARARELADELAPVDYRERFVKAMQSERVSAAQHYQHPWEMPRIVEDANSQDRWDRRLLWWGYPHVLRPIRYVDELWCLHWLDLLEKRAAMSARDRKDRRLGYWPPPQARARWWAPASNTLVPTLERASDRRDSALAQRGLLATALGLGLHRQRHGEYPAQLGELRALGWHVPEDPFSGQSFVYRREGRSFVLYSLGPDLHDDGGRPVVWQAAANEGAASPARRRDDTTGDILWLHWQARRSQG